MTGYKVTAGFTNTKPYVVPGGTGRYNYQGSPAVVNSSAVAHTLQQDQPFSMAATGLGTKSVAVTPAAWDDGRDAAYGATSGQWNSGGSKLPSLAGGIYNVQNQPPGASPTGYFISPVNRFVKAVIMGCHLNPTNDCSSVSLAYSWTAPTLPFCDRYEYYYRFDPNSYNNPQSDGNTKTKESGSSATIFDPANGNYEYWEPSPINQFPIVAISQSNPMVVTCGMNQAGSPASLNDVVSFFGITGMKELNGLSAQMTAQGGSNGAFTYTFGAIDSTGFSPYNSANPLVVSGITQASPAVVTLSTVSATHPLAPVGGGGGVTWGWFKNIVGMTQMNQLTECGFKNLGGSSGAWTAEIYNAQFNQNVDSTGFTAYSSGGQLYTGQLSVPFATNGTGVAGTANTTWINNRGFRLNPVNSSLMQNPDAASHTMASLATLLMPFDPANGWIRRRVERCWTPSTSLTPGYMRIYDNNVLVFNFVGRTDSVTPPSALRHIGIGSMYRRDRSPQNFAYHVAPYVDVSGASVTGACAAFYAGNASTFSACTILEPQPHLTSWTNTNIAGNKFNQGILPDNATVYLYAMTEAGTVVSDGIAYSITPVSTPAISTSTLPNATPGSSYSQAISASGGTAPLTYYLASSSNGVNPCPNNWAVNSSTGQVTGTPLVTSTLPDKIVVTVIDANGYNAAVQLSIQVTAGYVPDYYLGVSGSSGNSGTFASPWDIASISNSTKQALYAGKTVGLIGGTAAAPVVYGISSLMTTDVGNPNRNPALQIGGGTNSSTLTKIIACDASGNYLQGAVKIIANNNGTYGGLTNSTNAMIGSNNTPTLKGNWLVDGIVFAGFSAWCTHVGNSPSGGAVIPNTTFQYCTFRDSTTVNATNLSGVNCGVHINYAYSNHVEYQNSYVNCVGGGTVDTAHWSLSYCWGLGTTPSSGYLVDRCTAVAAGGWHGKEGHIQGTEIRYSFNDWTTGPTGQNGCAIQGFDGAIDATLTLPSLFHHNVLLCNTLAIDLESELNNGGWTTAVAVFNNTMVSANGVSSLGYLRYFESVAGSNLLSCYNNAYVDNGHAPATNYGYIIANIDAFAVLDYNCYGGSSGNLWNTVPNGAHDSSGVVNRSFATWKATVNGGADAHSQSAVATFSVAGTYADAYQVTSGALLNTGKVGGLIGGATVNQGAYDGTGRPGASWVT